MGERSGKHIVKQPDPESEPEVDHRWKSKFLLSQAELLQAFGSLGILVVGGSGAAKSALIKCLGFVDDHGGAGRAATKVWKHRDLPLSIHDTKGVSTDARSRIADIRSFLDEQDEAPLSDKVHLIWLVLRAADNRILEYNADLMKAVYMWCSNCKHHIPLQIIVTHMGQVRLAAYTKNVANHLDQLLAGVGVPADVAHQLEANIVKLGIVDLKDRGSELEGGLGEEDTDPELQAQRQALHKLCSMTSTVLSPVQQLTWASAEAVDVTANLSETTMASRPASPA